MIPKGSEYKVYGGSDNEKKIQKNAESGIIRKKSHIFAVEK
jgi:hypothetical protein